jgi:RING-type zinc-finger
MSGASYRCAACGQMTTSFSNRQRKRAEMGGGDARCIPCVTSNHPVAVEPAEEANKPIRSAIPIPTQRSMTSGDASNVSTTVHSAKKRKPRPESITQPTLDRNGGNVNDNDMSAAIDGSARSSNRKSDELSNISEKVPILSIPSSSGNAAHLPSDHRPTTASTVSATKSSSAAPSRKESLSRKDRQRSNVAKARGLRNLYEDSDATSCATNDDGMGERSDCTSNATPTVSLAALKEKVMGRKLVSMYDETYNSPETPVMNRVQVSHDARQSVVAEDVRRELACAICSDILHQPVSLLCGHSFCKDCVEFWLLGSTTNNAFIQLPSRTDTTESVPAKGCPTCRQLVSPSDACLRVNAVLRICLESLVGSELETRRVADRARRRQAVAGENGGMHERGHEVVQRVEQDAWATVRGRTQRHEAVTARRSIVLDDQDQRMQLALAIKAGANQPVLQWDEMGTFLVVSLCLITMEEDEVEGEGFPLVLSDPDDEHLIVTETRLLGSIEVTVADTGEKSRPLARRVLGHEGVAHFRLDTALSRGQALTQFCFRHSDTGVELHLQVPKRDVTAKNAPDSDESARDIVENGDHLVEEQYDNDDSDMDRFEDDGFVVDSGEEEEEHGGEDEDDACCLCHEGGEVIVCDGGDCLAGCGLYFHIACISRSVIPPGDWVCQDCAGTIGLNVGIEGHEFVASAPSNGVDHSTKESRLKRLRNADRGTTDSDSDAFESASFSPNVNGDAADDDLSAGDDVKDKSGRFSPDAIVGTAQVDAHGHEAELSPQFVAPKRRKLQRIVESEDDDESG